MISRRAFMWRVGTLGAGLTSILGAPVQAFAAVGRRRRALRLDRLTRSRFTELRGSRFWVYPALGDPARLTLVEASVLRSPTGRRIGAKRANGRNAFSLVFEGSATDAFPQNTYQLEHDRLGVFHLFLVPVGPPRDGLQQYQAILS
jgi:hypothetical protein